MNIHNLNCGAFVVTHNRFQDSRGAFSETWSDKWLPDLGVPRPFVQQNTVWTENKNTIRGLHAQSGDAEVAKFIRVIKGRILDVFVDARQESPTFGQWFSYELDESIPQILYIPTGFYHGYMTLSDNCIVHYQQDQFFTPEAEVGLRWDDETVSINWGLDGAVPTVSIKDAAQKSWADAHKF